MIWAYTGNSAVARSRLELKAIVMARALALSPALLQGCLLVLLAAGCAEAGAEDATRLFGEPVDNPEVLGGQSGTEDGGSYACGVPTVARSVAMDEVLRWFEFTPRQLAQELAMARLGGRWLAAQRAELSIELDAAQGVRTLSLPGHPDGNCSEVEASLIVKTSDGALDAVVPARIWPDRTGFTLDAALPALPSVLLGPAYPPDVTHVRGLLGEMPVLPGPALRVSLTIGAGMQQAIVYDAVGPRGVWLRDPLGLPPGSPTPFTADPLFTGSCAGAEERLGDFGHHTPFESSSAALAGVAKVWARCLDGMPASHAGIEISPDGSWRHFDLEAGELVARSGFGHEGYVKLIDTSSMNGAGFFQLELQPFGRNHEVELPFISERITHASDQALLFRSYNVAEDWPAAVYQPAQLSVRSLAPEFTDGERAGSAACDRPEHGLVFDASAAAPLLRGEFVLCTGSLQGGVARLRFEPGLIELRAEDGGVIASQAWDAATGQVQLDTRFLTLTVSRQPLKVLVEERLEYGGSKAVFSAVP